MKNRSPKELGEESIGKLLLQYALPAIVATAASSLYNIIDRIFIGQGVGPHAISGLALTFPLMNLAAAFGSLVGVGASATVSIRLGQQNKEGATLTLGNALLLNLIFGVLFSILTLSFLDEILFALGASHETLPYAKEFMQVILLGNVFTHIYLGLNGVMRSSGYPKKAMLVTLMTVALNLLFAPLFIFVFHWGIKGAAAATVLAQIIGTAVVTSHFLNKEHHIHFMREYLYLKWQVIKDIVSVGISNFLMLACATLIVTITNLSLKKYGGDFAIGAFGIINSVAGLFVMVTIGFNQGMQPIAGFNYGANQMERVKRVFHLTLIAGTLVTFIGFILSEFFSYPLAHAFTKNENLVELAVYGMRVSLAVFPLVGFQIVTASFFQSTGRPKYSVIMSLSRQVIFLIPALLILPRFLGLKGVWLAGPLADFSAALLTIYILKTQALKTKKESFNQVITP